MATDRQIIFNEIDKERTYQLKKWGAHTDDTLNTPWMWAAYVSQYATAWMKGQFAPLPPADVDRFRESMLKTAALAIAAIESIDRQRAYHGGTFYEQPVEEEVEAESDALHPEFEEFLRSLDVVPQFTTEAAPLEQECTCPECQIGQAVSVPEEITDLFVRLGSGQPFSTEELFDAARFFADMEERLTQ